MKKKHKGEMPIGGMDGLYPSELKKLKNKDMPKPKKPMKPAVKKKVAKAATKMFGK